MKKTNSECLDYESENFVSRQFFCWAFPLIRLGRSKVNPEDYIKVRRKDSAELLGHQLQNSWELLLKKPQPKLWKAVFKIFGVFYIKIVLLLLFRDVVCRIGQGPCIMIMLQSLAGGDSIEAGVIATVILIVLLVVNTWLTQIFMFQSSVLGMRMRVSLTTILYYKILRLPHGDVDIGQLMNFAANDVNRFDRFIYQIPYIITTPVQFIVMSKLLWSSMGISVLPGLGLCSITIIIMSIIRKKHRGFSQRCAEFCATRARITAETISNIQYIKICGWEDLFRKMIYNVRSEELKLILKRTGLVSVSIATSAFLLKLSQALMIAVYQLSGYQVSASKVFVLTTLMNYFTTSLSTYFPTSITGFLEIVATCERLQKVLLLREKEVKEKVIYDSTNSVLVIEADNAKLSLGERTYETFSNITFSINRGQLVGVVGPIGCGKSTLLKSIIGESKLIEGKCTVYCSRVEYVSQDPWIFPATVWQNITFGRPYDPTWFQKVVDACGLGTDLDLMPNRENEFIGDRGITLSGGQKSRINLARAVYADADLYLLDDPLSAVDVKIAKIIMDKCICGLLKTKAVILVTHQVQHLKTAHLILALKDGGVEMKGTFNEVVQSVAHNVHTGEEPLIDDLEGVDYVDPSDMPTITSQNYGTFYNSNKSCAVREEAEEQSRGDIKFSLHWTYWTVGGVTGFAIVVSLFAVSQTLLSGSDYWLKTWIRIGPRGSQYCLIVYLALALGFGVTSIVRNWVLSMVGNMSSRILHERMLDSLLRAKMHFYQVNNAGRIINRCVGDIGMLDDFTRAYYLNTMTPSIQGIASLIVIGIVCPITIIPTLLTLALFSIVRVFYAPAGFDFKRGESLGRSPIFAILNSTLRGLVTIRGSQSEDSMISQLYQLQDRHSASYFCYIGAMRWYVSAIDWITTLYAILIVLYTFFTNKNDPETAGLIIASVAMIVTNFSVAAIRTTELDNALISTERIVEYIKLQPEASLIIKGMRPPKAWPSSGRIEVSEMSLRYGTNPPILRNINLAIEPYETIGVVGRTGAGKSSLVSALFRLEELSTGYIHIDGINISKVGLHDLRPRLEMVQQSPMLLQGTLRRNLDPLVVSNDEKLWSVIKELQLENRFRAPHGQGLDSMIADGGGNLSLGERQLVTLARAIIRDAKILVLDEATASVDNITDALIQDIIRNKLANKTKIIIAHRLSSVMDCDKIAVLDAGNLIEFDQPYSLLQNKNGHLNKLCEAAGEELYDQFIKTAQLAYEKKLK